MIRHHQRGIGGSHFVAVHTIGKPRDRQGVAVTCPARGDIGQIRLDRINARHVFRRSKHQIMQRTPFPTRRILHQLCAVWSSLSQRAEIGQHFTRGCDPGTRRVSNRFSQCRYVGIGLRFDKRLRMNWERPCGKHRCPCCNCSEKFARQDILPIHIFELLRSKLLTHGKVPGKPHSRQTWITI